MMVSTSLEFVLWGLAIIFVVIILPNLLGSMSEWFQSPGMNKEKSAKHKEKTKDESEDNEINRKRMQLLWRG